MYLGPESVKQKVRSLFFGGFCSPLHENRTIKREMRMIENVTLLLLIITLPLIPYILPGFPAVCIFHASSERSHIVNTHAITLKTDFWPWVDVRFFHISIKAGDQGTVLRFNTGLSTGPYRRTWSLIFFYQSGLFRWWNEADHQHAMVHRKPSKPLWQSLPLWGISSYVLPLFIILTAFSGYNISDTPKRFFSEWKVFSDDMQW